MFDFLILFVILIFNVDILYPKEMDIVVSDCPMSLLIMQESRGKRSDMLS